MCHRRNDRIKAMRALIRWALRWRLLRYFIAGGTAFVSDYGTFLIWHYAVGLSVRLSSAISFLTGLVVSYLLQKYWVFEVKHQTNDFKRKETYLYVALAVFNLLISVYGVTYLKNIGLPAYLAKLLVIVAIMIWNYVLYKKVIFSSQKPGTD